MLTTFSVALLASAFLGPYAGGSLDKCGSRPAPMVTSRIFVLGLGALSMAQGTLGLFAAWVVLGRDGQWAA